MAKNISTTGAGIAPPDSSGGYPRRGERVPSQNTTPPDITPSSDRSDMAYLSAIVEACQDALTGTSLDGTIVVWNPCAESLFGYPAAEVLGRPVTMLLPGERSGEPDTLLTRIAGGESIDQFDTIRMRKDGTPIEVSLTVVPVRDDSGAIIGAAAIARDITERKRIERELYRWRNQLQAIAQGVDDAVIVREPGGSVVYANDHAARLLGFASVADLVGMPAAGVHSRFEFYTESGEMLPNDELPGMRALDGFETQPRILRFHQILTGEERWAVVKAVPVRDENGQVQFAASIFSDITERKRAEEGMKASEARFQAFMDNSPMVAFIKDEQARFVYVNPQFERAFQTTSARLIGTPDTAIVPSNVAKQIHSDDAEVLATGKLKQIVEVIPAPDGTLHHWLTFKFPLSLPGDPGAPPQRFIAGASVEITDRVRAEEALTESEARFQAFMHNAPIVAYMKDEHGRVVFLNPAWEQLFGMPVADALGKDDYQLHTNERAKEFRAADKAVLETGRVKVLPETVAAADGTLRHWMTFKFPIVLPSGARFVGGASVEITDRVRAEEELQRYAERLQTLSRQLIEAQEAERRRISRDLHDQVGQSLTAIKIDLQIAQHQAATTDSNSPNDNTSDASGSHSEFVERLGQSIDMVERTIQQVREFSLDLRPSILDDLGLPSALLWYVEEQARRAGFQTELAIEQLKARMAPELEITCFRVAQEAITNVVRHAHATRMRVELRRSADDIVLTIADNGAGFDTQALAIGASEHGPRASDHESECNRAAKGKAHPDSMGTLGLTGMNERVHLMGGHLSISSVPGEGTTLQAVFPLGPAHPAINDPMPQVGDRG